MGIPYSRQINAAFEEVTPLVAAGFKVLRTTRNISILLAVIQVLTVFLLFLILLGLVALLYCVNPDLEVSTQEDRVGWILSGKRGKRVVVWVRILTYRQYERINLVTPWLKTLARITILGIVKSVVSTAIVLAITGVALWKLFIVKRWVENVEYEGNVDADEALENLPDLEREEEEEKEKEEAEKKAKEEEVKKVADKKVEQEKKKGKGKKK